MSGPGEDEPPDGDWIEQPEEKTALERAFESPQEKTAPRVDPWVELTPPPAPAAGPLPNLGAPVQVTRKTGAPPKTPRPPSAERSYPLLRALLADPEAVPYGAAGPKKLTAPVPGTFFPAPREPIAKPAPADLDTLLNTMADGLLIGETPSGGSEVRVTLKDEFFAGTELRITVEDGRVRAVLVPPDREIYWQLNGNVRELRERLESRGLRVEDVTVVAPS